MHDEKQKNIWKDLEREDNSNVYDLMLEKEFISTLVQNPDEMKQTYGVVDITDLFNPVIRKVYEELRYCYESHELWNLATLHSTLSRTEGVLDILLTIPTYMGGRLFQKVIEQIKKWSLKRKIYNMSHETEIRVFDEEPEQLINESLTFYRTIETTLFNKSDWSKDHLIESHQELMKKRNSGQLTGIPSGLPGLDEILGQGLQRKDLIIIGARPSVGKTSLSLTLAYNAALANHHSLFISCEMDTNEILDRLLGFDTGMPVNSVIRGTASKDLIKESYEKIKMMPLAIVHIPKATSTDVYDIANKYKNMNGLDLLVIDYLGYLSDYGENEVLRLGMISRALKTTANLLDVAVIAPHQLSRRIEQRSKAGREVPLLSDLRDSGHLEQDADVVMFLNRDTMSDKGRMASLRIGKNRTGQIGIVNLKFNLDTTRFTE